MVDDYLMDGDLCEAKVLVVSLETRNSMHGANLLAWAKPDIFLSHIGHLYFNMLSTNRGEGVCND